MGSESALGEDGAEILEDRAMRICPKVHVPSLRRTTHDSRRCELRELSGDIAGRTADDFDELPDVEHLVAMREQPRQEASPRLREKDARGIGPDSGSLPAHSSHRTQFEYEVLGDYGGAVTGD